MARISNKRSKSSSTASRVVDPIASKSHAHTVFIPLLVLTFLVWIVYRSVFAFPVWFDESIGKALFFGIPVWLYINMTGSRTIVDTLASPKMRSGLLLGVAFGGVMGFAAAIFSLLKNGSTVQAVDLFNSTQFWWEFILAIMTAFWETLLFYSWVFVVLQEKYRNWSLLKQLVVVAGIFVVFHIPNALLRFNLNSLMTFSILMFLFAIGQGLLFVYRRNAYALIMSHAIWGMVLLVHLR